jgi:pimeloyl-ACP methyl ester carboxylesterase
MWCGQDSNWGKDGDLTASDLQIARDDGVVLAASLTLPERTPAPALAGEEMEFEPEAVFAEVRVPTLLFYGEDDDWITIDESIAAWRRARGDEVEIVRVPGTGHDPVLVSGEVLPRYTETLVTWLRARS